MFRSALSRSIKRFQTPLQLLQPRTYLPATLTPLPSTLHKPHFSTSATMSSINNEQFLEVVANRRSTYTLSPETTISDAELQKILEAALEEAPSTFGSFTTRIVTVLKEDHYKLWDIVTEVVKGVTPPEQFENTKKRLDGFRNAYGTILFFEDPENTRKLENMYPFIKEKFSVWSEHTSAIHQFIIWTALANAGLGANLQHYNPIIDDKVKAQFNVPAEWSLVAQLVFGKPTNPPAPKPDQMKKPLSERLQIHGA